MIYLLFMRRRPGFPHGAQKQQGFVLAFSKKEELRRQVRCWRLIFSGKARPLGQVPTGN
jgi:hypothetical protein